MHKRFLLFGGDQYYPGGGWEDFVESFRTLDEAVEFEKPSGHREWWHVVDTDSGKIVTSKGWHA